MTKIIDLLILLINNISDHYNLLDKILIKDVISKTVIDTIKKTTKCQLTTEKEIRLSEIQQLICKKMGEREPFYFID
jgi:hypothetical protein